MKNDPASDLFSGYPSGSAVASLPEWQDAACVIIEDDLLAEAQQAYLTLEGRDLTNALDIIVLRAMDPDASEIVQRYRMRQAIEIAHGTYAEYVSDGIRGLVELPQDASPPSDGGVVVGTHMFDGFQDDIEQFENAPTDPCIPELPSELLTEEE